MTLDPPSVAAPLTGGGGRSTAYFQAWLATLATALNRAIAQSSASVPKTTNIIAAGGLQRGGALTGDVGIALYRAVAKVSQLPSTGNAPGDWAYAIDGRKPGEASGLGTGVPVFWSVAAWFAVTSGVQVTA